MDQLSKSLRNFIRLLHDRQHRVTEHCILVEGRNAIEEAFRASLQCHYIVAENTLRGAVNIPNNVTLYEATAKDMEYISSTKTSYGIVGVFEKPVERAFDGSVIMIDGLQDPGNLGTLIRSAAAFGLKTLVCVGAHVDPYSPKVIRSSAGFIFHMNCIESDGMHIASLLPVGMEVFGTHLTDDSCSVWDIHPRMPYALVIGSEGHGISPEIMKIVTKNIRIPIEEATESLNAAVAGSIIMGYFYGRCYGNNSTKTVG